MYIYVYRSIHKYRIPSCHICHHSKPPTSATPSRSTPAVPSQRAASAPPGAARRPGAAAPGCVPSPGRRPGTWDGGGGGDWMRKSGKMDGKYWKPIILI